jgi:predicted O-methyltransferase YrrM
MNGQGFGGILKRISRLSLRGAIEILRCPSLLPARFQPVSGDSIPEIVHFAISRIPHTEAESYQKEFEEDTAFFDSVNISFREKRGRDITFPHWQKLLYALVRASRPERIVETGIFDGHSSAVILQALEKNGSGELISIDLPAYASIESSTSRMTDSVLPDGEKPGWIIPDRFRRRHRLVLGDSKEYLPKILDEIKIIDIFIHDSLHTFEHQWFEYATVWPHIAPGGLLLSDDVFWNTAYNRFCKSKGISYRVYSGFGVAKK